MPKKISREDRNQTNARLDRSKRRTPPEKRKTDVEAKSTSSKKIKPNASVEVEDLEKHYRIIDFILVFSTIASLVKCAECDGKVSFQSCKKEGLGFNIKISCEKCKQPHYVPSSKTIDSGVLEVNYRFAFAMRLLGLGLAGCNKLCGLMDLSSSFITKSCYNIYMAKMCSSIKKLR